MLNNIYGGGTFENYSTDEEVIGRQIDGKPIYRKTITGLNIKLSQNNQNYTQSPNIDPLISNVKKIISIPQSLMISTDGNYYSACQMMRIKTNGKQVFYGIEDYTINEITIEYTKTTD